MILRKTQVRDVEHKIVQIFQAQAPNFKLIGQPVSDDELYSLVNTGDNGNVIRFAVVDLAERPSFFPPLARVEAPSTKFNLPIQEPSSPHSSTGYDASDEELGMGKKGTRMSRCEHGSGVRA